MKIWLIIGILLATISCTKEKLIIDSLLPDCALPGYVRDSMARSQQYLELQYIDRSIADTSNTGSFVAPWPIR